MRRTLVRAVLFGSALGGLIFENSAVAGAQSRCAGGRTLSETSKYRLFARDDIYFACLRSTGIEAELRGVYEDEELRRFKVSGRYFVYEAGSSSSSGDDSWLDSVDMKTGRWARITEDDPVRFVVRATGSVAWSTVDSESGAIKVKALRGRERALSSGTDVEPDSLRLRLSRVFWREGGSDRSARLP